MKMSVPVITPKVLVRADSAADVAEMRRWKESDLFSVAESGLEAVIAQAYGSSVRNRIIESLRLADGSPHFLVYNGNAQIAIYVLCISSIASEGALSAVQYAWAETHSTVDIIVLPCVVQCLKKDLARCVAEGLYAVRSAGHWSPEPKARQFLPSIHRDAHYCGGASLLKMHNAVREVANGGTRIYPYVAGVAGHQHMPSDSVCRCSGSGTFPLVLVQTSGARDGALRVGWSGIYSAENPVNELEIYAVHRDELELMDSRGCVYSTACAELALFPGRFSVGMHLRWAVSLFADSFAFAPPAAVSICGNQKRVHSFCSCIKTVSPVEFGGLRGYCLQACAHEKQPDLLFNVYVFEQALSGRVPRVGDYFESAGLLLAAPDSLVESAPCWADSPQTAVFAEEDLRDSVAEKEKVLLMPYGAPMAELLAAFVREGYKVEIPFIPLYRFGRPEFRLSSPSGERLFVMVDYVVGDQADKLGYRCRFHPDKYPAHINKTPQGDGPGDICFVSLHLTPSGQAAYSLKAELHGASPKLSLPTHVSQMQPQSLSAEEAAQLFADCMATQSFEKILPFLREDLHYSSDTAGLEFFSKMDFLRHLRSCFDTWKKKGVLRDLEFAAKSVVYKGSPCVCCVASQKGEAVSATLLTLQGAFISDIRAVQPM